MNPFLKGFTEHFTSNFTESQQSNLAAISEDPKLLKRLSRVGTLPTLISLAGNKNIPHEVADYLVGKNNYWVLYYLSNNPNTTEKTRRLIKMIKTKKFASYNITFK